MKTNKRNFIVSASLILLFIVFTILVKLVDVQAVGVNGTSIGFATINKFIADKIGTNMTWYNVTDWLGFVPVIMAVSYVVIGIVQLIKRKSLFKVDKEILILGIFYILLIAIYIFFEKVVVNYRPVLMDGYLEASYPSSHTLMAVCICGSTVIVNSVLYKNKIAKITNIFSIVVAVVIVVGRLVSGVHWFTDILGGIIISLALLMTLFSTIKIIKNKEEKKTE